MIKIIIILSIITIYNFSSFAMENKPYHHLPNGTFRNSEGSPKRDPNVKFSYKIFNEERNKIKIE